LGCDNKPVASWTPAPADLMLEEQMRRLSLKLHLKLMKQISIPKLKMMFNPRF
jgi:hypothetical protein